MSEERHRGSNILEFAKFERRPPQEEPPELPQMYGRINAKNIVEFGLIGVSAADSDRLLRALMHLGIRLLEIGRMRS